MVHRERQCDFPREWLIAYRDGALHAAQLEISEAHIRVCAPCRAWLREMDEVDRILRDATPLQDDPAAREAIKTRVAATSTPAPSGSRAVVRSRLVTAGLILVFLTGVAMLRPEPIVEAGNTFARWFTDERTPQRTYPEGRAPGTVLVASSPITSTPVLPYGLAPAEGSSSDHVPFERFYRSDSGLAIAVSVNRSGKNEIPIGDDPDTVLLAASNGRDVLLRFAPTEEGRAVIAFDWVDGDALYTVFVLDQPPGGLTVEAALEIAAALMTTGQSER